MINPEILSISIYYERGSSDVPFGRRATILMGVPDFARILQQEVEGCPAKTGATTSLTQSERVLAEFKRESGNMLLLGTTFPLHTSE